MTSTIILIGPISAGKTTVAALVAQRLSLPHASMDEVRWAYYQELGYDDDLAQQKRREQGWWARYSYWKPFEAHAVERMLEDYTGVIDLGAGHSVYEDDQLFARIAQRFAPYPYVILLLPTPDIPQSVRILSERDETAAQLAEVNAHFLRHHSNYDLAKYIIYTKGKIPEEIRDEIVQLVEPTTEGASAT